MTPLRQRLLPFLLALSACTPQQRVVQVAPVPPAADPKLETALRLSQQNVDAAIYQHSSAEIHRLYAQCYELARIRLDANLARAHDLPAAVIVDIDETVLDNSPYQIHAIAQGTTYTPAGWSDWTHRASAEALPGSLEFLTYAAAHQCEVFYISNRSAEEKNVTVKNLFQLGFPMADEAHVLCMDNTSDKTDRRALVSKKHYVALLVGDQLRDLDERFKDRTTDFGNDHLLAMKDTLEHYFILLPNPMYGTWLDAISGRADSLKLGNKQRFFTTHTY